MSVDSAELMNLLREIANGDEAEVICKLEASPRLATACAIAGATRQESADYYLLQIEHYVYTGDTALHIAAAGYRHEVVGALIALGADVRARNRRGAEPLHYAADGIPGSQHWNPLAQAATIALLINAGADPDAMDQSGVAPLHRAVRTRCASAVRALLDGGADPNHPNKNGSTPLKLATHLTGRGGSGTPESKAQQEEIVKVLAERGAKP